MAQTKMIVEPGTPFMRMERVFDAPRALVFKVWIDPKHIPQWWGPKGLTTRVDQMDVKPGGLWRFVQRDQQGNEHGFHGVYHSFTSPEQVVSTFEFEGAPGHVVLETATFEALPDGKTRVITSSVFQSLEDLDSAVSTGMESGAVETWERFAELLVSLETAAR